MKGGDVRLKLHKQLRVLSSNIKCNIFDVNNRGNPVLSGNPEKILDYMISARSKYRDSFVRVIDIGKDNKSLEIIVKCKSEV